MKTSWLPSWCVLGEAILALAAGFFSLLAMLWPDWLESFGVQLDYGSGGLEWAVPIVLALIAVAFGLRAGRRWRIEFARAARARA